MSSCPDCDRWLRDPVSCPCGWKMAVPHETNPEAARAAVIAEMSRREEQAVQPHALEYCRQRELHTVEDMKAWLKSRGFKT